MTTALFGSPSSPTSGFGSPILPSDVFNGITYPSVNHIVTTNIGGGGIGSVPTIPVLITGQYTHFTGASVIDLGPGITPS